MNLDKLKYLESSFLDVYPDGFNSPEMLEISKKHKVEKMLTFVQENFQKNNFDDRDAIFQNYSKLISRSSLVSVFEKTQFRNDSKILIASEREYFTHGLYEFLYGDQPIGFKMQIEILSEYKLAKWPILSLLGFYMSPENEVFIKPTTAKNILKYFEVDTFHYTSKPNYEFYDHYRHLIHEIKMHAGKHFKVDNAAFCGFLMMTIQP